MHFTQNWKILSFQCTLSICIYLRKYISRQNNSWLRFSCQKVTNPYTQISNGRISASFYRLSRFKMYVREQMWNFWKTDKFLSFLVYLNQKWHFCSFWAKYAVFWVSMRYLKRAKETLYTASDDIFFIRSLK